MDCAKHAGPLEACLIALIRVATWQVIHCMMPATCANKINQKQDLSTMGEWFWDPELEDWCPVWTWWVGYTMHHPGIYAIEQNRLTIMNAGMWRKYWEQAGRTRPRQTNYLAPSLENNDMQVVLHISKFELFEISKFRSVLVTIFECQIFSVFCHLEGEKSRLLFWYICANLCIF